MDRSGPSTLPPRAPDRYPDPPRIHRSTPVSVDPDALPPPPPVDTVEKARIDAPLGRNTIPSASANGREDPDPHGFSPLVDHLDSSVLAPRRGALLVAAAAMDSGEHAYGLLAGRYLGHLGVALLTDKRLLAVNARAWSPNLAALPLTRGLTTETWTVSDALVLRFAYRRVAIVIDGIHDGEGARQFVVAVRSLAR